MSATINVVSSASKNKRTYRKGNPLSAAERQQTSLMQKKITHKEVRVFVRDALKYQLRKMCKKEGITQSEMIERLIEIELIRRI